MVLLFPCFVITSASRCTPMMNHLSSGSIATPPLNSHSITPSDGEVPLSDPKEGCFTVTVYASSSSAVVKVKSYAEAAFDLGKAIASRGWVQVNGGGNGLMGRCTDGSIKAAGTVDCVVLKRFVNDMSNGPFRDIMVHESMIDRRTGLYRRANAFVALPGGLGTLEELAEVISWRQLEFHRNVVVLVNTNGFYDHLWQFIERGMDEGFIAKGIRKCVKLAATAEEAVQVIEDYKAEPIHKKNSLATKADWIPTTARSDPPTNKETPSP